jgi:hypothetical protein
MRKGMAILAGTLVVLLAWTNVGLAGQRNRLRERVATLEESVSLIHVAHGEGLTSLRQMVDRICETIDEDYPSLTEICPPDPGDGG